MSREWEVIYRDPFVHAFFNSPIGPDPLPHLDPHAGGVGWQTIDARRSVQNCAALSAVRQT